MPQLAGADAFQHSSGASPPPPTEALAACPPDVASSAGRFLDHYLTFSACPNGVSVPSKTLAESLTKSPEENRARDTGEVGGRLGSQGRTAERLQRLQEAQLGRGGEGRAGRAECLRPGEGETTGCVSQGLGHEGAGVPERVS